MSNYKPDSQRNNVTNTIERLSRRIPPQSKDAEMAVLGAMMLDRSAIPKVISLLETNSFYDPKHKILFDTMIGMYDNQVSVDIVTLGNELVKRNQIEIVGGTFYLLEINNSVATAENIEYHARIVQEKFLKRLLIQTSGKIMESAYDDSTDALEEIDKAEQDIFTIAEKRLSKSYLSIKDLTKDTMRMIASLQERDKKGVTGVDTGLKQLNVLTGGFQNSDLIILAGRPSMGKTALGLSIARNAAVEYGHKVGIFSIEMAAIQLVMRLLSAESKIDGSKLRTGRISPVEMGKLTRTIGRLADAPILIDDSASLTVMELRAKARRMVAEHGVEMIMIDYLQLMHAPKAESREREISTISRALKQIAKELNIPVLALAQLNRSVEGRNDKRPMLSDLRESGSIEQDADVVMFIHRPEYYKIKTYDDNTSTEGTAEIIIGKQRNGPVGTARVAFVQDHARFENLAINYQEPPMHDQANFNEEDPF